MVTFADIEQAAKRLKPVVHRTPILSSRTFNRLTGLEVYFKAENFQRVGAFKIRGAYNKISSLSEEERKRGVIAHSSGNHAQGVALACKLLGIPAVVVMPEDSVPNKVEATKSYGAEVVFTGPTTDHREETIQELIERYGYTLVPPFDDDWIIAGQGTVVLEIYRELKELDYLIVPVGGGGLISGCAIAAKNLYPNIRVIGVETEGANDCYLSFRAKKIVKSTASHTIADGLRTLAIGKRNFEIIMKYVDDVVLVKDDDVVEMIRFFLERMKIIAEPSGAVAATALLKNVMNISGKKVCALISGGNIDIQLLKKLL